MEQQDRTLVARIVAEIHLSAPATMHTKLLRELNDEVIRLVDSLQTRTMVSAKAMQRIAGPACAFDCLVEEPTGKPWKGEKYALNEARSINYFGFTLTTCRRERSGGWHPIVRDRQGRKVSDEIEAPWLSRSEAEMRATDIAKRELEMMGESVPDGYPDWGGIRPLIADGN